jgi:hypothetical protein
MLTFLMLVVVFTLPFLGARVASSGRALSSTSNAVVMGGLLVWLLLIWSTVISLAWPAVRHAFQHVSG